MIEQFTRHPGLFLFSVILALIPTIAWGYYYYQKDAMPKKTALVTFFAGTLSVVPVLFYQFSWSHIPDISIHYYIPQLINSPGWYTVGFFVIVFEIIAFISTVISALAVMIVALLTWTKGVVGNVVRAVTEEDSNFKIIGLLIAVFAAIVVYSGYSLTEALIITVSLATLEEFVKHLIVRFVDDNRLKSIDDAIEFSILVGLGFAFAENIFYFFSAMKTGSFVQIFIFRSILSVFAHVFFSGVFGYFYGLAHFATPIYHKEVHENRHVVLRFLHKIFHMRGSVLFHEEKMMEGLLIAAILHSIFNYLLQLNQIVFVVPFLFVGFFVLSYLFDKKQDHKEFQFVSAERTTGKIHKLKAK
jgi:RsiW-degrading membrane proteinase PrsW (M82 family)